jgi:hypothetical protein
LAPKDQLKWQTLHQKENKVLEGPTVLLSRRERYIYHEFNCLSGGKSLPLAPFAYTARPYSFLKLKLIEAAEIGGHSWKMEDTGSKGKVCR